MVYSKEDMELETLKKFLKNINIIFYKELIELNKEEPTDIRYNGINYQITEGDKESVQERRSLNSKGIQYSVVRDTANIADLLLKSSLTKKSIRSDSNTVLLIDVMTTGMRDFTSLEQELSIWAVKNINLCNCWKEIYLVYPEINIKLSPSY